MLIGSRPSISVCPREDQLVLLAVRAETGLGHVHQLRAGLGVLDLGDVDLVGSDARRLERSAGGEHRRTVGALGASDGLNTSNVP